MAPNLFLLNHVFQIVFTFITNLKVVIDIVEIRRFSLYSIYIMYFLTLYSFYIMYFLTLYSIYIIHYFTLYTIYIIYYLHYIQFFIIYYLHYKLFTLFTIYIIYYDNLVFRSFKSYKYNLWCFISRSYLVVR